MLVSKCQFERAIEEISPLKTLALDTETTGLHPYLGDELFSVIIGSDLKQWYFNFLPYDNYDEFVLPRDWICKLNSVLTAPRRVYLHNAKFDMHFLHKEGVEITGTVHDTMVMARLLHNDHMNYSLAMCGERIGFTKSDAVEEYIKKHKLYEWETKEGKKNRTKKKFFSKVPAKIMVPYGERDAYVTYQLGEYQRKEIEANPRLTRLHEIECETTPVVFDMERAGVRVDKEYSARGFAHERQQYIKAAAEFEKLSGSSFKDSSKALAPAFEKLNERYPRTEKGNPSFTDKVLKGFTSPLASWILEYRYSQKMAHTYFQNFIDLSDGEGRLHPNFRQAGTVTGRFSMADPNLQNVPKELPEGKKYDLRKCFIPKDGYVFVEIDYDAMEFKLMLDYAGQTDLIERIKAGLDPHQATADITGLLRKQAKTLNFGLLYGMGVAKLAGALGVTEDAARTFKRQYFGRLPLVEAFIQQATATARVRGNVFNWAGRTYQFPDVNFAYKAANAIIQGGCSDIVRVAMVGVHKYLTNLNATMLLQVHDSLLLEVHKDLVQTVVPQVKRIMEQAYTYTHLPMTCSVEWSDKSWGDLVDWEKCPFTLPSSDEARDKIQSLPSVAGLKEVAQCLV